MIIFFNRMTLLFLFYSTIYAVVAIVHWPPLAIRFRSRSLVCIRYTCINVVPFLFNFFCIFFRCFSLFSVSFWFLCAHIFRDRYTALHKHIMVSVRHTVPTNDDAIIHIVAGHSRMPPSMRLALFVCPAYLDLLLQFSFSNRFHFRAHTFTNSPLIVDDGWASLSPSHVLLPFLRTHYSHQDRYILRIWIVHIS